MPGVSIEQSDLVKKGAHNHEKKGNICEEYLSLPFMLHVDKSDIDDKKGIHHEKENDIAYRNPDDDCMLNRLRRVRGKHEGDHQQDGHRESGHRCERERRQTGRDFKRPGV